MRKFAKKEVGYTEQFEVFYDAMPRQIPMHLKLKTALPENKEAKKIYNGMRPSLKLEIACYILYFKTE